MFLLVIVSWYRIGLENALELKQLCGAVYEETPIKCIEAEEF